MYAYSKDSIYFKYRSLFNGYLPIDEISIASCIFEGKQREIRKDLYIIDDLYGRFFSADWINTNTSLYGSSDRLKYYNHGGELPFPIIGEMRVPYRKIPIYKVPGIIELINSIKTIEVSNPSYKILLRGQTEVYTTHRDEQELQLFYGSKEVIEPSFMPSFSRKSLDEKAVVSAWYNLADMLLNELNEEGVIISDYLRKTEQFHLFALGIAQHYGLPSIGLDLTDNVLVALWFALFNAHYDSNVHVKATLIPNDHTTSNIYVFRCPPLTFFSYNTLNLSGENERPVRQNAFFNHCGWGMAKNQLALNLAAVFNIDSSFEQFLPENFISTLFPYAYEDRVLKILLDIRDRYKGTRFGEMLKTIYV